MSYDAGPSAADAAIYLDHNATTPIAPEVLAMRPYLEDRFGSPSSAHRYGAVAHRAVECARAHVAALLGCEQDSIVFSASGSEPDNLAIKGVALGLLGEGDHIIISAIEHPAVLGACRYLERRLGYRLTILPVDGARGIASPIPTDQLALALTGLANGLAIEELADPGAVADELLGDVLTLLVAGSGRGGSGRHETHERRDRAGPRPVRRGGIGL